jgi:ABC-type multidrug transport system permease subunit
MAAARVRAIFGFRTIEFREMLMMGAGIVALAAYAIAGAPAAGVVGVAVLAAIALYCGVSAIRPIGP